MRSSSRGQPRSVDRRLRAAGAVVLVAAFPAASCAELPELTPDICGNAVIDRVLGEECDGSTTALRDACLAGVGSEAAGDPEACQTLCGAPGTAHACQLVWDVKSPCPSGFGAGADGRCRRPSGCFETTPLATIDTFALEGDTGDFNGDGVADLLMLTTEGPSVTLFGPKGSVLATVQLPFGFAAAGALTDEAAADAATDLVIPGGPAFVTVVGPEITPRAYAPFPALKPDARAFGLPLGPGQTFAGVPPGFDVVLLMVQSDPPAIDVELHGVDAAGYQLGPAPLVFPNVALSDLVGDPVFANVLVGTGEDGVEVVIATSAEIFVGSVDDLAVTPGPALLPGEEILGIYPVLGHPETEVAVITAGTALAPAYSLVLPTDPPTLSARVELPVEAPPTEILALGYINSDDDVDLVARTQVFFATPNSAPPAYLVGALSTVGPWTGAGLADVSGGGRLEIVAISEGGSLTVLSLGSELAMNPTLMSLPATPTALALTDIDGDAVTDIVVATTNTPKNALCSNEFDIVALYGRPAGLPEPPVLIGRLRGVMGLASARLFLPVVLDGVQDLLVQTCGPGATDRSLGVFLGSTTREVFAPYSPYVGDFDELHVIERIVVGDFGSPSDGTSDLHLDVAFIATIQTADTYQRELRILPVVGDARYPATTAAGESPGRSVLLGTPAQGASELLIHFGDVVAGDLFAASPTDELAVVHLQGEPLVATFDIVAQAATGELTTTSHPIPIPESWGAEPAIGRVRLFDYDADGDLDALVAIAQSAALAGVPYLFLNDGSSLVEIPFELNAPFGLVVDAKNLVPPTCLTGDVVPCDPSRAVLYATYPGVLRCAYGQTTDCTTVSPHAGLAAVVGDYDDDGVEDLALLGGTAKILRQCPVSEVASGACGPPSCRDPQAQ